MRKSTIAPAEVHHCCSNLVITKWKHFPLIFTDTSKIDVVGIRVWFVYINLKAYISNRPCRTICAAQCLAMVEATRLASLKEPQKKFLILSDNKSVLSDLQSFPLHIRNQIVTL